MYILPENLDLKKLHNTTKKILRKEPFDRCQGRTTGLLYLMLSDAMFPDFPENTNILFTTHSNKWAMKLMLEFIYLLDKEEIGIELISELPKFVRTSSKLNFYFASSIFDSSIKTKTFSRIYCDEIVKHPESDFSVFCKNIF